MNSIRYRRGQQRVNRRRMRASRRGAAAVEFAIVANVFFVLIFTCMEFARMNMIRCLAQDAAYFAAREAMVPGASIDEAKAAADSVMNMLIANGYQVDVNAIGVGTAEVIVTITVDFDEVALFAPMFMPDTTIKTVARIKSERYDGFFEQE